MVLLLVEILLEFLLLLVSFVDPIDIGPINHAGSLHIPFSSIEPRCVKLSLLIVNFESFQIRSHGLIVV